MSNQYVGSCLCGAVRFEIEGRFDSFFLCHCRHCQKDTGSAHAANLFSSRATIKWVSGKDKVTEFNLPSTRHVKAFCSICGSALPSVQNDGAMLAVPAGSVDSVVDVKPNAHIFTASRADWCKGLDAIPEFEKFPS